MGSKTLGSGNDSFAAHKEGGFLWWGEEWRSWTIDGGAGNDTLTGGPKDDTITGSDGNDSVRGGDGNDYLHDSYSTSLANNDIMFGGNGNDSVYGGAGNDTLFGDAGNDIVSGWDGTDNVYGWTGNDTLYGGEGNDYVNGQQDHDLLYGEGGGDVMRGDAGNDVLYGQGENDVMWGDAGYDHLDGGAGDDLLIGAQEIGGDSTGTQPNYGVNEIDTLISGSGKDTFRLGNKTVFYNGSTNDERNGSGLKGDYAVIDDFHIGDDKIQLYGNASIYRLELRETGYGQSHINDTVIRYNNGDTYEVVGVVKDLNLTSAGLNSSHFTYTT